MYIFLRCMCNYFLSRLVVDCTALKEEASNTEAAFIPTI